MNSFLRDVALSLNSAYGEKLCDVDVVFASRRAIIYFNSELDSIGAKIPRSFSMNKWICRLDEDIEVESRFVLISKLFEIYSKFHPSEDFEKFYSFGNMLVSDFDMIDRYLVDAESLYSIVSDTREIEVDNSDELRAAAIEFWNSFDTKNASRHKQQEFLRVWRSLYDIYKQFTTLLDVEKIAYSGRVYRRVAETFDAQAYGRKTIFVGLNALSKSEVAILSKLQTAGLADFIWDYDPRWLEDKDSECGYFISHNIKQFFQADYFKTSILSPSDVKINVIEAPSDVAQTKLLPQLLRLDSDNVARLDEQTAIILTDENLLLPLLYSLPESVDQLNISMGYPLRATLAYRFAELLIRMQRRMRGGKFYAVDIKALYAHTYMSEFELIMPESLYLTPADLPIDTQILWKDVSGNYTAFHNYLNEALGFIKQLVTDEQEQAFIANIIDTLGATIAMINKCKQEISVTLYLSLLASAIAEQSLEFKGVSGRGLQIMGILESRALDFKRVIMLSMNDDNFPSSRPDSSYIPQLLLQGYGMPTIAEKSAIWSYYFYRLLQRSSDVELLYCNVAEGMNTGEQSRYIWQLEYSSPFNVSRRRVSIGSAPIISDNVIEVPKTDAIVAKAESLCYYPTMLSSYHNCPLSFYFASIERIKRPKVEDENFSAMDTGNLLHKVMQTLYGDLLHKPDVTRYISLISDSMIISAIDTVMRSELNEKAENKPSMASIIRTTLKRMVTAIVRYDSQLEDLFSIEYLEERVEGTIAGVKFTGIIDRVDRKKDGSLRVIDYKSGAVDFNIKSITLLFDEFDSSSRNTVVAQILIYSILAQRKWKVDITPSIYAARQMGNVEEGFISEISINKQTIERLEVEHYKEIEQAIGDTFVRMCNVELPFTQTADPRSCNYCDYRPICSR